MQATVGSRLYGTATKDSDTDKVTIYIPRGDDILLQAVSQVGKTKTAAKKARNTANDVDETHVPLHTFALYLVTGNLQHGIEQLFVTPTQKSLVWDELFEFRHRFLNKTGNSGYRWFMSTAKSYLNGPFSSEYKHVKTRYHLLRIGFELIEFYESGWIQFPLFSGNREILLRVKNNEALETEFIAWLKFVKGRLLSAYDDCKLPEAHDAEWVNEFVAKHYERAVIDRHNLDLPSKS